MPHLPIPLIPAIGAFLPQTHILRKEGNDLSERKVLFCESVFL
jgi:hypothetical protein